MSCLAADAVTEMEGHSLDNGNVKDMIREHHAALMRELSKQQEILYSLQCWSQDFSHRQFAAPPGHLAFTEIPAAPPPCENHSKPQAATQHSLASKLDSPSSAISENTKASRIVTQIQARIGAVKEKKVTPTRETRMEKLYGFVADGPLDILAGIIILINALFLVVEMQQRGSAAESILRMYPEWPTDTDRPEIYEDIEYAFLAFYVCETVLRITVLRKEWYYHPEEGIQWGNFLDALIVLFGLTDLVIAKIVLPQEGETHFGAVLLRILRVGKIAKTMRLVRVMQLFSQLRSMVETFVASLTSLFWSMVLLLVCMMIAALVLCESCVPLIVDPVSGIDQDTKEWLLIRYGSFSRAMYTMFEITFSGGWPVLVRPLVDDVSVFFAVPCLIYVVAIVFAALRLITALMVRSTMHVLNNDAASAVLERMEKASDLQDKLLEVFHDADSDGDGRLTMEEFEAMLQHKEMRHYLSILGVDVRDARMLFRVLDDGNGTLSVQEFCDGIAKVKGGATSADIVHLLRETGKMRKDCQAILAAVSGQPVGHMQSNH